MIGGISVSVTSGLKAAIVTTRDGASPCRLPSDILYLERHHGNPVVESCRPLPILYLTPGDFPMCGPVHSPPPRLSPWCNRVPSLHPGALLTFYCYPCYPIHQTASCIYRPASLSENITYIASSGDKFKEATAGGSSANIHGCKYCLDPNGPKHQPRRKGR